MSYCDAMRGLHKPVNFDQFLEQACPMNETEVTPLSNPAHYAREVLVRELMTWRNALDNITRRVKETQLEMEAQRKLQLDAQHRVSSLETALRTV